MNLDSKYYKTWEDYQRENPALTEEQAKVIAPRLMSYEEMLFQFIMFLCV